MGTTITDWAEATGAMYMGAGTGMPFIWFLVALAAAVIPLLIGFQRDMSANR